MKRTLIYNATLVNEGQAEPASLLIEDGTICQILKPGQPLPEDCDERVDATGCYLLPGVIDEHVHFREPGMTHKADIWSESRAAAAGGVTSIMDMPNNNPPTVTLEALEQKFTLLQRTCIVNHSCYFGATNSNYTDFARLDAKRVCGIKLFMGSSTGNMLVDKKTSLQHIFHGTDLLIAAHCEDSRLIQSNMQKYKEQYKEAEEVPVSKHCNIRSAEACYRSSRLAVQLARESGARLHLLHLTTERELALLSPEPLDNKRITAEACVAHLLFSTKDYKRLGTRIKCNPSVKRERDRNALRRAVNAGLIDTIATDHAPHLLSEKAGGALKAASGMPMVQFSLVSMLELADEGVFSLPTVVEKMCHAPARLYRISQRGYLRPGYRADLVLVKRGGPWTVTAADILSKCGWSPLEGHAFSWRVLRTWVNGHTVYQNGKVDEDYRGEPLLFER